MMPIRVVIADDHLVVRAGIRGLLEGPRITVVGMAADGTEALRLAEERLPDVLVLDLSMPGLSGVEVARRLRAAGSPVRVLALSAYDDDDYVFGVLEYGAAGYLLKDDVTTDLAEAVRAIANGESGWCSRRVTVKMTRRACKGVQSEQALGAPLSPREREVLILMARSRTNEQIADALSITVKTVENHVTSILAALGVHSRADAVIWAWERGLTHKSRDYKSGGDL